MTKMHRCRNCARSTQHHVDTPNHVLHGILTLITAGLWLLPWLLVTIMRPAPTCIACGTQRRAFGL